MAGMYRRDEGRRKQRKRVKMLGRGRMSGAWIGSLKSTSCCEQLLEAAIEIGLEWKSLQRGMKKTWLSPGLSKSFDTPAGTHPTALISECFEWKQNIKTRQKTQRTDTGAINQKTCRLQRMFRCRGWVPVFDVQRTCMCMFRGPNQSAALWVTKEKLPEGVNLQEKKSSMGATNTGLWEEVVQGRRK